MMPWEHVAVGYVGFSLFLHAAYSSSPTAEETLVVAAASLLPDLVDKPLAWQFGVFDSGYALGHSVLFAVPVSVLCLALARSRGRPRLGIAFTFGYLLHLPGDLIPRYIRTGRIPVERVLWPIRRSRGEYDGGFGGEFIGNVTRYVRWIGDQALSGSPEPYFGLLVAIGLFCVSLWIYDGMPVGREGYELCRRAVIDVITGDRGPS